MSTRLRLISLAFAIAFLTASPPLAVADPPLNEKLATAAWEAFKTQKYEEAIRVADMCIEEFRGAAMRRQREIDASKGPIPSGRVTDAQKTAIFKNGTLNDCAAALYVKGRSLHALGRKDESAKVLAEAKKYPSARVWDPRGWFFSPAVAAQQFLTNPENADKAPHEAYTAEAWAALNKGEHAKAVEAADKCISEFLAAAGEMQKELAKSKPLPTGAVDEETKKAIFSNGVLNDVTACMFIIGKASEARGDKAAAIKAYREAVKLSQGRCWDPHGWFWNPAEAASDRLEILR